ncbi:hypothetical protein COCOBI_pt-2410 (chloroplast) [Coccomyxa sp. Obi]|nr:hypothetical protein COCOBI_pt-2410 [Coccomyxa sp. Obi]
MWCLGARHASLLLHPMHPFRGARDAGLSLPEALSGLRKIRLWGREPPPSAEQVDIDPQVGKRPVSIELRSQKTIVSP